MGNCVNNKIKIPKNGALTIGWSLVVLLLLMAIRTFPPSFILERAPYDQFRWEGQVPLLKVEGKWYLLEGIGRSTFSEIIRFSKEKYGIRWKEMLTEEIVEVLWKKGKYVGFHVTLSLRQRGIDPPQRIRIRTPVTRAKWERLSKYQLNQQQIRRKHQQITAPEWKHLQERIDTYQDPQQVDCFSKPSGKPTLRKGMPDGAGRFEWLCHEEAIQDLDRLEYLLEHYYAYLDYKKVDYRSGLDAIRSGLGHSISRKDFGLQIKRFLCSFGDPHTDLVLSSARLSSPYFLPFLPEEHDGRILALNGQRHPLDERFPFVRSIDSIAVEKLLDIAGLLTPQLEKSRRCGMALEELRKIGLWRALLDLPHSRMVEIVLECPDRIQTKKVRLPTSMTYDLPGDPGNTDVSLNFRVLPFNIGYLKITDMEKGTRFRRKLNRIIKSLLGTSGLIIDVRGNRGGSREAIFVLLPYFISEPTIINVAALRIDQSINPLIKDSYGLESRFLYLRQSMAFSDQEKKIIDDYLAADLMDEIFPNERFSLLHFAIASPKIDGKRQYENPVIILMDSRTLSAAEIFLAAFQTQPQVFLMGSPSCGHSGFSRTFRLPFSGYDVHMSTMLSFLPNGQMIEDRGIQADIFQPLTLEDKLGKRDSQLDSAVAYLRRSIR